MDKLKYLFFLPFVAILFFLLPVKSNASLGCVDYGFMAYEDFTGYCKCMSGYIWGKDIFGKPYCVSGLSYCVDKYGYGSEYDYLTNGCKCSSGYSWNDSGTSCISNDTYCYNKYGLGSTSDFGGNCKCRYGYAWSKDTLGNVKCIDVDDICTDRLGSNAKYNTSQDKCECRSGYELSLKSSGGLECKSCMDKYGYHSSFNSLINKCECDNGYVLDDDNQCVQKQNNVYFYLKEVDTNSSQAIVKSNYDYEYYLVNYGTGCLSSSFDRYLNKNIIINLGTNFNVDTYDKIVLYNDNEVCYITEVSRVDSNYTFIKEDSYEAPSFLAYQPLVAQKKSISKPTVIIKPQQKIQIKKEKTIDTSTSSLKLKVVDIDNIRTQSATNSIAAAQQFGSPKMQTKKSGFFNTITDWLKKIFSKTK